MIIIAQNVFQLQIQSLEMVRIFLTLIQGLFEFGEGHAALCIHISNFQLKIGYCKDSHITPLAYNLPQITPGVYVQYMRILTVIG